MRVWYNKTFSSIASAIQLIKKDDISSEFTLISSHTDENFIASLVANEFYVEPKGAIGEKYCEWCLDFAQKLKIDIFVPGKGAADLANEKWIEKFENVGTKLLVSANSKTLKHLENKAEFYDSMDLPLAKPAEFKRFKNFNEFQEAYKHLKPKHHTLCVKPSVGVYAQGFSVLDDEKSTTQLLFEGAQYRIGLQDFINGLKTMNEFPTMLLMEYLPGDEYSVDCLSDKGKLVTAIARRKSTKNKTWQTIDNTPQIIECVKKLAADYKLNGIFNAQFRERESGLSLLEINARMSGGMGMACMAGVNLPYLSIMGLAHGFDNIQIPKAKSGIRVGEQSIPVILQ